MCDNLPAMEYIAWVCGDSSRLAAAVSALPVTPSISALCACAGTPNMQLLYSCCCGPVGSLPAAQQTEHSWGMDLGCSNHCVKSARPAQTHHAEGDQAGGAGGVDGDAGAAQAVHVGDAPGGHAERPARGGVGGHGGLQRRTELRVLVVADAHKHARRLYRADARGLRMQ